jgi:feruloyl esterase
MLTALEHWVEQAGAPDLVVAERSSQAPEPKRSRPLCPYPQQATYKGTGSTDDAANFTCAIR